MADQLADGRRFRALAVVDVFTREGLAIEVGQNLSGADVVRVLSRICSQRGVPKTLFCDNGSEFTSQALDLWAYQAGVKIDFSRPETHRQRARGIIQRERCGPNAWTPTGSGPWLRPSRSSKRGDRNTMRVVLTGLTGRGRPTKSPRNSKLAANSFETKTAGDSLCA